MSREEGEANIIPEKQGDEALSAAIVACYTDGPEALNAQAALLPPAAARARHPGQSNGRATRPERLASPHLLLKRLRHSRENPDYRRQSHGPIARCRRRSAF